MAKLVGAFKGIDDNDIESIAPMMYSNTNSNFGTIILGSWLCNSYIWTSDNININCSIYSYFSYGIKKIVNAFKDLDPKKEVSDRIMVLVLPAMSIALQYHLMHWDL
jgi:hypothetical protein